MFTKKRYIFLARFLKEMRERLMEKAIVDELIYHLSMRFVLDNPKFNQEKFLKAANYHNGNFGPDHEERNFD